MQRWELESYVDPGTKEAFELTVVERSGDEIITGALSASGDQFPIVRGVPRFSSVNNYADNFGFQWTEYAEVQLDSRVAWGGQSEMRLGAETKWPDERMSSKMLQALVRAHVAWLYPVTGLLHRVIGSRARYLSLLLSMADYRGTFDADDATFRTLSELNTFDMLSPAFDKPQLVSTVRRWFASLEMECVDVRKGFNGIQARGPMLAV